MDKKFAEHLSKELSKRAAGEEKEVNFEKMDIYDALEYAEKQGKRIPEVEEIILKHKDNEEKLDSMVTYAQKVIKGRWPEAESYIMKSDLAAMYLKDMGELKIDITDLIKMAVKSQYVYFDAKTEYFYFDEKKIKNKLIQLYPDLKWNITKFFKNADLTSDAGAYVEKPVEKLTDSQILKYFKQEIDNTRF